MRRLLSLGLAGLVAIGVIAAIVVSVAQRQHGTAATVVVKGVIGSEKQPFFQDPDVQAVFHKHGYDVQVQTAGSREIATSFDLSQFDFAFPAGAPAAEKIRTARKVNTSYAPFYTPMAIATFQPIVQLLTQAGVVHDEGSYRSFDIKAYLDLVQKNTRWSDLPGNSTYKADKSILITSTDVRTSNSAAMYLSLASYVANGNNVVQDTGQAQRMVAAMAPLFLRQGFTESSSQEPFEDYLTIGMGKTPLVMIYEAQYLARAAANDGSIRPDMVLLYPSPTVYSKHTLVPVGSRGDRVGQLLVNDPDLQRLAVKYGFRNANTAYFDQFAKSHHVTLPGSLNNVIDPPAYDPLETMISGVQQLKTGGPAPS
jgi:hypothetical protein